MEYRIVIASGVRRLTAERLYDILKLRQDVFLFEENIHYPDLDDVDKEAIHVFAVAGGDGKETVASYARVYFDMDEGHVKIGRVVTAAAHRGGGLASKVMANAVSEACKHFGVSEVWLDAQEHVVDFYARLGFTVASEPFIEAGIKHVKMVFRRGQ